MRPEFKELADQLEPLLKKLLDSPKRTLDQLAEVSDQGVYVFYENGEPTYVGRSNRVRSRIREHGANGPRNESATFALKLLRKELDDPGGHSPRYSRKKIDECLLLKSKFAEKRKLVRGMQFQVVGIKCQRLQYLFESYAIICLKTTEYNSFVTT